MKNKKLHIWIALAVIVFLCALQFLDAERILKGIRDMRFGIDIRGGVEAVFETVRFEEKSRQQNSWRWQERSSKLVWIHRIYWIVK